MDSSTEMDRFYQRMRSDLMYELRNIQLGERPVTGQSHRQNLQDFIARNTKGSTGTDGKHIEADGENADEHRPEAVVVEIQGIIEQRPVSSILQSAALRRRLEHTLLDSLGRTNVSSVNIASSRIATPPTLRTATPSTLRTATPPLARTASPSSRLTAVLRSNDTDSLTPSSDRTPLSRQDSVSSLASDASFSSAYSFIADDLASSDVDGELHESASPPLSSESLDGLAATEARQTLGNNQELPHVMPPNHIEVVNPEPAWNEISAIHRQELIEEISDLLHERLVSSTLDGEFRATLELQMQDRVSATGANGNAVQNFIRSLPRTGIRRNDFSDLGIPSGIENENWDNISVTNISAHSVPYNQTNTFLSREIQQLKGQMAEMKNLLKMSIDIQMEVQRSVRQEVAAALAQGASAGADSLLSHPPRSQPINDTHCLICLDKHTDTVLYQCGHMCVCFHCGRDLMSRNSTCPVCRAPIKDVIRAYKTNAE